MAPRKAPSKGGLGLQEPLASLVWSRGHLAGGVGGTCPTTGARLLGNAREHLVSWHAAALVSISPHKEVKTWKFLVFQARRGLGVPPGPRYHLQVNTETWSCCCGSVCLPGA